MPTTGFDHGNQNRTLNVIRQGILAYLFIIKKQKLIIQKKTSKYDFLVYKSLIVMIMMWHNTHDAVSIDHGRSMPLGKLTNSGMSESNSNPSGDPVSPRMFCRATVLTSIRASKSRNWRSSLIASIAFCQIFFKFSRIFTCVGLLLLHWLQKSIDIYGWKKQACFDLSTDPYNQNKSFQKNISKE